MTVEFIVSVALVVLVFSGLIFVLFNHKIPESWQEVVQHYNRFADFLTPNRVSDDRMLEAWEEAGDGLGLELEPPLRFTKSTTS